MIVAQYAPFKPNISHLSKQIDATRGATLIFLNYLRRLGLITYMYYPGREEGPLSKPDLIYLSNTSLTHLLVPKEKITITSLRETYFVSQMSNSHYLEIANKRDFIVDSIYHFEIGEAGRDFGQIKKIRNHFIATDGITTGYWNKIPLWLFGFLY